MNAPQPPPEWTHTPEDVLRLTKKAIDEHRAVEDKIGALQPSECTYGSFETSTEPLGFYQNVSPSKELRDASTNSDGLVRDYGVESSMRLDVFQAKLAAEKNIKSSGLWEQLSSEDQRLVDKMILAGKRAGLGLPEADRNTLTLLQKELSQVCLEFDKNFNEEKGVVSFTKEELDGVPADVISGYTKRTEGSTEVYDVTYKTPDIFPVFKFATRPETRQRAYEGHESRLEINVPLVEKFLGLRRQIAKVLKYPTWADYRTEPKMVKTGKGVVDFLDDLENKLAPVGLKDRETLLALKKKEHEERGLPFDGNLYIWDYRYYDRKYIETSLELDDMLVKEYFPVSVVNLLGVRFETINGSTWHPDVQQFAVWEKDATDESGFIGYCYLDLFPRESKYSHAAVWPLLSGYTKADGKRSYPLAAMVANLAKPTPDKPALMRHDDVVTYFHEFGHVFHGLLSQTKFAKFHGTKVARDFVEAPSQMLENWCWEPEVLEKMSSHYETKQPLSPALIEKIIKSRYVNVGLFYLRQVFFAKFDIKVHTDQESEDYTLLWNSLREKISLVKSGKPCPGQGSFGHISGGYDAGYYGYTYSLVFASDMYATVFKGGPLDPARGKLYRDKILKYGGSREELESLEDFLGRPPNSDAFLKELFGTAPAVSASL
ncbi:metallopeptidase MepB [Mycena galopus ATCC 62051]|nr:metallopeptidase MepB [Mycena galopus ATCC 62051]